MSLTLACCYANNSKYKNIGLNLAKTRYIVVAYCWKKWP